MSLENTISSNSPSPLAQMSSTLQSFFLALSTLSVCFQK